MRSECRDHLLVLQDELAESNRDCGHLRLQVAQLTHNMREGEKRLERCREQLAVAVGREERLVGKSKQTYARLKSAWAQAKGTSKAAGAISAAARELRPVEIVGLYEEQRSQVCPLRFCKTSITHVPHRRT